MSMTLDSRAVLDSRTEIAQRKEVRSRNARVFGGRRRISDARERRLPSRRSRFHGTAWLRACHKALTYQGPSAYSYGDSSFCFLLPRVPARGFSLRLIVLHCAVDNTRRICYRYVHEGVLNFRSGKEARAAPGQSSASYPAGQSTSSEAFKGWRRARAALDCSRC